MRIGTDIVHIPGIKRLLDNKSLMEKMFHPSEMKKITAEHLAGVLAAKEAFFKAINQKPRWLDIEIAYEKTSRPKLKLSTALEKDITQTDVSISHDKDYAVGFVILNKK